MIKKLVSSILILFIGINSIFAQSIMERDASDDLFLEALEQFNKKQYNASQQLFIKYLNESLVNKDELRIASAVYYDAIISIYLYHADGEQKIKQFIDEYPNHPLAITAYYEIGNFYYREENYPKAIQYYELINIDKISADKKLEYQFKLAYSYFSRRAFEEALPYFQNVKRKDNSYQAAARYYSAFINYEQNNFDQALDDLLQVKENPSYRNTAAVMIASLYYKTAEYEQLYNFVDEVKEELSGYSSLEIQLLLADSYYQQKDYKSAYESFEVYFNSVPFEDIEEAVGYRIAYSAMKTNHNELAIKFFKKAALADNKNAQFSSYYLGQLYAEEGQLRYAVNAFNTAASFSYDKQVQEYSAFQEAKLLISTSRFSAGIQKLNAFVQNYPSSKHKNEVSELLSEAYLNTNAYAMAIEFLESIERNSSRLKQAYQKVTFYQGVDFFNNSNYPKAVELFQKSTQHAVLTAYESQAYFWMGEAYSIGKRYEQAINAYALSNEKVSSNDQWYYPLQYGFGYALYNTTQYDQALYKFKNYVDANQELQFNEDAIVRLADCYYAIKRYSTAMSFYRKALVSNSPYADYANFQLGLINGIEQNTNKANQYFDQVISSYKESEYYDDALFQKALLAFENGSFDQAIDGFSYLLKAATQSTLRPYALSKRAIAYYNQGKYEAAAIDYKNILDNYLTHNTANGALLGLQEIYNRQGKEGDLAKYIAAFKKANPDDKAVASIEYEAAQNLYFNQKYEKAIPALKAYIQEYEGNSYSYEARYYLADAYYRSDQFEEALAIFKTVVEERKTTFVDRAKLKIADINLSLKNYEAAISAYKDYLKSAETDKDKYNALNGLLTIAEERSDYQKMEEYALDIINNVRVNENALNRATLKLGLSYYYRGNYTEAKTQFNKTIEQLKDNNAAEASYMLALIEFNSANYKKSLELLFELTDKFSNYTEWVGKSFLLIADNYYKLNEDFQAIATLKSIIENADDPLLVNTAEIRLKEIQQEKSAEEADKEARKDSLLKKQNEIIIESDSTKNNE